MAAYTIPFALYLVLTVLIRTLAVSYAWFYPAAVVISGGAAVLLLRGRGLLRPHRRVGWGVAAGLVGIALWIGIEESGLGRFLLSWLPGWLLPGPRMGFDPFQSLDSAPARIGFLAFRGLGLMVLIPVVEELFWRGFLARWLGGRHWQSIRLGDFTPFSFLALCVLFAVAHSEWVAAFLYCALLNALLIRRRDLWDCVVAHAVSNLVLFVYVLATSSWALW